MNIHLQSQMKALILHVHLECNDNQLKSKYNQTPTNPILPVFISTCGTIKKHLKNYVCPP